MRFLLILCLILLSYNVSATTYRIGALLPLSGTRAEKGIPLKNALELFAQQFNAQSGEAGDKLELVIRDDFDNPEKARIVAQEMAQDKTLVAVIGHYYTDVALQTKDIFAAAQIPFISPNVSSSEFLDSSPWMFMMNLSDAVQGGFIAVYIKEVLKKDNVLVVYDEGKFGTALYNSFLKKASHIGLNVSKAIEIKRNQELPDDWTTTHLPDKIENEKIGMVVGLSSPESGVRLLKKLRDYHINTPVMASYTWNDAQFFNLADHYTKNVYVASSFLWELANAQADAFASAYQAHYGVQPTPPAAMAHDTLFLLSHALATLGKDTKNTNYINDMTALRKNLREALVNIDWQHALEGVTGLLFFKKSDHKIDAFIEQHLNELRAIKPDVKGVEGTSNSEIKEHRALHRDVFVSEMKNGRLETAAVQLTRPRDEYVLKQVSELLAQGKAIITDKTLYQIVDVISVGMDISRISDVNVKDMNWEIDAFLWFKWKVGRVELKDIEDQIKPINLIKELRSVVLNENLTGIDRFRVYRKRYRLESHYDLSAFPFDSQTLKLSIAHINKHSSYIMLIWDERQMDSSPIHNIKPYEWHYLKKDFSSGLYRYASTFGDPNYRLGTDYKSPIYFSTVNLTVDIKRILQPYFYTFFLPLGLLLGIILLTLLIPLNQFAPRISSSISGLVGILLYHMAQKNMFPKVGYTMIADYYFLAAYILVITLIIFIISAQILVFRGQEKIALVWNKRFSIIAVIGVIGTYALITWFAIYAKSMLLS